MVKLNRIEDLESMLFTVFINNIDIFFPKVQKLTNVLARSIDTILGLFVLMLYPDLKV